MTERIDKTIQTFHMLQESKGIVIGVSGGSDSMCLLHYFIYNQAIPIAVAHINHGLRDEADEEQQMVETFCHAHHVPCFCLKEDVAAHCPKSMSIEQYARTVRYEYYEKICEQLHFTHIATAHNANDNLETFFLHLLRGCGTAGNIPPVRIANKFTIIRPLIKIEKPQIIAYCRNNDVPYCTDRTNFEEICTRNILRNRILPELTKLNPNLQDTISRFIQANQQDDDYLTQQAQNLLAKGLTCSNLGNAHQAILSRSIRAAAYEQTGLRISKGITDNIIQLIKTGISGNKIDIGDGFYVQRIYDNLLFLSDNQQAQIPLTALHPGNNLLPCGILTLLRVDEDADIAERYAGALFARSKKQGDTVKLRKRGTKTIKKLFSDAKVPLYKRALIPVIESDGKIVFVCHFGPTEGTNGGKGYKVLYEETQC